MATANYYRMFALHPSATNVDIKRRYRQLSFEHHPDRGGSVEKMMLINEAYSVLSNSLLRREYDRRVAAQQAADASGVYNDFVHTPPRYAQQEAYSYQPSYQRQTAEQYYYETAESSAVRSFFWVLVGVIGALIFGFVAFQLYDVVKSSADTGQDIPVSISHSTSSRDRTYYRDNSAGINNL